MFITHFTLSPNRLQCPNCRSNLRGKALSCTANVVQTSLVLSEDVLGDHIRDVSYEVYLLLCQVCKRSVC